MNYWTGRVVLVTGGAGMCGSYLCEILQEAGARVVVVDDFSSGRDEWLHPDLYRIERKDARDLSTIGWAIRTFTPSVVFHLAARVEGITYNEQFHSRMLMDNGLLQLSLLKAVSEADPPPRVVLFSTACVLPSDAPIPTPETALMGSGPEPTNRGYGWAKRIGEMAALDMMAEDFRQNVQIIRPWNMYSERDHFGSGDAHVIPALTMKMLRGDDPLSVRGTGKARRSFVHARDVAKASVLIAETSHRGVVHVGSEEEVTIEGLFGMLWDLTGWSGSSVWDSTAADGYPRRLADTTLMRQIVRGSREPNWNPEVALGDGLRRVVEAGRKYLESPKTARQEP